MSDAIETTATTTAGTPGGPRGIDAPGPDGTGADGVGIDPSLWLAFTRATGFLPQDEALALYRAALAGARLGALVEIGTYQGKSAILLAAAARVSGRKLVTVDHHRGSEEHQPGWDYHDPSLVDPLVGRVDTLQPARRTLALAGVEQEVVMVVGRSPEVAALWSGAGFGFVFIDGGHTDEAARADYDSWAPLVALGGVLAIHDVFPDPADGGQAPYRIYRLALDSGEFAEDEQLSGVGSLRVLRRIAARG
jgi:MMP 1-O-methyltransferase